MSVVIDVVGNRRDEISTAERFSRTRVPHSQ